MKDGLNEAEQGSFLITAYQLIETQQKTIVEVLRELTNGSANSERLEAIHAANEQLLEEVQKALEALRGGHPGKFPMS